MDMTGYTKLFGSIVASTIWRESHEIRIVWITMLAMADKDGVVQASLPGLADMARVTLDECKVALKALDSPDEYSRTPDHEGRRIRKCDGGWLILNHAKYRARMNEDERRDYFRKKKQEYRAKESKIVQDSPGHSTVSTQSEAEAKAEPQSKAVPPPSPAALPKRRAKEEEEVSPFVGKAEVPAKPERPRKETPVAITFPASLDTPEFRAAWRSFIDFRKAMKKPLMEVSQQQQLKSLSEYPVDVAIKSIAATIANGWQGLFPDRVPQAAQKPVAGPGGAASGQPERWEEFLRTFDAGKYADQVKKGYRYVPEFIRGDYAAWLKTK